MKPARPPAAPAAAAYAPVVNAGVQTTVQTVHDMHHAISDTTFDALQRVPGLSVPTRLVQGVHDAIAQGVYAAVRHGSGALMSLAGMAERLAIHGGRPASASEQSVQSALNGVFGDALAQAADPMAVQMGLHAATSAGQGADRSPLPMAATALAWLPARVGVFVHGLACDESSWRRPAAAWQGTCWEHVLPDGVAPHYGALLAHELGIGALYLRYNTGLSIAHNARRLADMLQQLQEAAPQVSELVLVGHSMGGLVARSACDLAAADGLAWRGRVHRLVCLGTPHQGALLERLGHLTSLALGIHPVTRPLAALADRRSQGIKDLRHGLLQPNPRVAEGNDKGNNSNSNSNSNGNGNGKRKRKPPADQAHRQTLDQANPPEPLPGAQPAAAGPPLALRFIAASLGDDSDRLFDAILGKLLGDGLVMPSSASDEGLAGDVQRVELAGLSHMALLNHPRVYVHLREWLAPASLVA